MFASSTRSSVGVVRTELGFARPEWVSADPSSGLLRARTIDESAPPETVLDFQVCDVADGAGRTHPFDLESMGFDVVGLEGLPRLRTVLDRVNTERHLSDGDVAAIRSGVRGASFRLGSGKRLRILYVAPEGIILRQAGPAGLSVLGGAPVTHSNGHGPALSVHVDQDVRGTPVRQILRGLGRYAFRHQAPHGRNLRSPFWLVNLWLPLQQVTRPLALMDIRSLDRQRHQLQYALPTTFFPDRPSDRAVNDIWAFLHHPDQRWHFLSDLDTNRALVFDTLSTPHGAIVLPGEEVAKAAYLRVHAVLRALASGDVAAFDEATLGFVTDLPPSTTAPLRAAIEAMESILGEARRRGLAGCVALGHDFVLRAERAADRVVRRSIELRTVGLLTA